MSAAWDPGQYHRFQTERRAPFYDLLRLVRRRPGTRVVDLGCGTGELTRLVHLELQAQTTLGVDNAASMLARAPRATAGLEFVQADIATFAATAPVDLMFSNAALHWLANHEELFTRLTRQLAADGQLAVQMPANFDQPSHTTAAAVADEEPFRSALGAFRPPYHVHPPEAYAAWLARLGYREQHVRQQVYGHWLASRDDVVEWVKGTTLVPYRDRLPAPLYAQYLERYRQRLLPQLEETRPFFFPFKRLLIWAQR